VQAAVDELAAEDGSLRTAIEGTISEVLAGSGLEGGGSEGSVSLTVDPTDFNGSDPVQDYYSSPSIHADCETAEYVTLGEVTMTTPGAGRIVVLGAAYTQGELLTAASPRATGYIGWSDSESELVEPINRSYVQSLYSSTALTGTLSNTSSFAVYPAGEAGTHTFYLRGSCSDGPDRMRFRRSNLVGFFIPN